MKIVSFHAGTEQSPLAHLLEHFPDRSVSSSLQSNAHHMALFFKQPCKEEQTGIVLSCLSTLFKSMKLSLGEKDGGFQAGKGNRHF